MFCAYLGFIRRVSVVCVLVWLAWPVSSQAQCTDRVQLLTRFAECQAQPPAQRLPTLSALLADWNRCGYPADSSYVAMLLERGKAHYQTGTLLDAIADAEQALSAYRMRRAALNPVDQIKAYYRLGIYWRLLNESDKARRASEQAVNLSATVPPCSWTAFALTNLARINYSAGDYQKAVLYAEQGMNCARLAHDTIAYIETWGEKVVSLLALNDSRTHSELLAAIKLAHQTAGAGSYEAELLMHKARIANAKNDWPGVMSAYRQALQLNQAGQKTKNIIDNYLDLGFLYYERKEYAQSLTNYNTALGLATDPYVKLRLEDNIGAVYWQKGQYPAALAHYQTGLTAIPIRFTDAHITALPNAEAIRQASQKEFLLTLIQDKADTWLDWGIITKDTTRLRHALHTYERADQMIDYMRWEHTGQRSQLYWRRKTRGLYARAIETGYRLGDMAAVYRFMEKSRAVLLADKLNELGARRKLPDQLVKKEDYFRQRTAEFQYRLTLAPPQSLEADTIRRALLTAQNQADRFRRQVEQSNPVYYRYKYDNHVLPLAQVQSWLKRQRQSLVTYFVGDTALYVLGLTPTGTRLIRRPIGPYSKTVEPLMALLTNPISLNQRSQLQRFWMLGSDLYQQVLAPLNLPAGRVLVSPYGAFVPFDALSRSANRADYLLNQYAFSYTYSVQTLLKQPPVAPAARSFVGVAPVQFASRLAQVSLGNSDKALERVSQRFGRPMLLTGENATRQAFRTAAPEARVVQLFTHADADSTDREPTLYFADSVLRLSDLQTGPAFQTQLLILSACKTGIGADQKGEGVFSMARGFAALGIPSILTTLWSVEDQATYTLTDLYYEQLAKGLPKDLALQQAKQEFYQAGSAADQLPSQWAGLVLVGSVDPIDLSAPARPVWPWIGGSLLLVGAVGSYWLMRRRRIGFRLVKRAQ